MVAFFLSAILFSIVFGTLLFSRPSEDWIWRRVGRLNQQFARYRYHDAARGGVLVIVVLLPLIAVVAISGFLHSHDSVLYTISDYLLSYLFLKAALGAIFAALFVFWIAGLFAYQAGPGKGAGIPVPTSLYVELLVLALLFFAGISEELAPYLHRLTGVKTPFAEITLSSSESRDRHGPDRVQYPVPGGSQHGPTTGLLYLSTIADIIDRDNIYLKIVLEKPTPDSFVDQKIISDLDDNVGALGRCHSALYQISGELDFARREFHALAPALKAFSRSLDRARAHNGVSDAALQDLAATYARAWTDVVERAFVDDLPMPSAQASRDEAPGDELGNPLVDQRRRVLESCASTAFLPCQSLAGLSPVSLADADRIVKYCHVLCDDLRRPDVTSNNHNYLSSCEAYLQKKTEYFDDKLTAKFIHDAGASTIFINSRVEFLQKTLRVDPYFWRRPYLAMIYSAMASLSNESDAAAEELYRWIHYIYQDKNSKLPAGTSSDFYLFRALSMIGDINDEWETQLVSPNEPLENYIRYNQKNVLEAMSRLEPILDGGMKQFVTEDSLKSSLESMPPLDRTCPFQIREGHPEDYKTKEYVQIRFASSFISNELRYVNLVLNDDDEHDWDEHASAVSRIMSAMRLDFGCFEPIYGNTWKPFSRFIQAEIRRTESRRVVRAIEASKDKLTSDDISRQYRRALQMLTVAKALIEYDYRSAHNKRNSDLDNIATTDPIAAVQPTVLGSTYREILQQQEYISQQINNL